MPMSETRRCSATAKLSGEQCRNAPILGGTVCSYHGGSAPQVRAAANRNLAETAAMRILREQGTPPPDDRHPVEHLLAALTESAMVAEYLGKLAAAETPDQGVWRAWERERDRRASLAKASLDAGVDERRVRLAEANAVQLAGAIRSILADLGVVQDRRVVAVVQRRLRELSGGGGAADGDAA